MKLSVGEFSVTDYFTLKHQCQCKVRICEVPPGPAGINPCDKVVWTCSGWNICLSGQTGWRGSVLCPYLFTPCWWLPELTGKPIPVVIPWAPICTFPWFVCAEISSVYSFPLNHAGFLVQTLPLKRSGSPNQAAVSCLQDTVFLRFGSDVCFNEI